MTPVHLRVGRLLVLLMVSLTIVIMACGNQCTELDDDCDFGGGQWNGSFECGCRPTLAGWRFADPEVAAWTEDAPPGGGRWCLRLEGDSVAPRDYAFTSIPAVEDGDKVRLSAFVRGVKEGAGGDIGLCTGRCLAGRTLVCSYYEHVTSIDRDWTYLTVDDSIRLRQVDSVWVILRPVSVSETAPPVGLFDMVVVERLNK